MANWQIRSLLLPRRHGAGGRPAADEDGIRRRCRVAEGNRRAARPARGPAGESASVYLLFRNRLPPGGGPHHGPAGGARLLANLRAEAPPRLARPAAELADVGSRHKEGISRRYLPEIGRAHV